MSRVRDWWIGLSRAYQHAFAVAFFDSIIFVGMFLGVPLFHTLWSALTSFLPNIYEPIFLQLVALVRDAAPGAMVASGAFIAFSSTFLTLLTIHLLIGFGLGFLFDHAPRTLVWAFIGFFVMIAVLFVLHLVLLLSPALTV